MNGKQWIQNKLVENTFSTQEVYNLYDEYLEETGLEASKETYKRKVRKYLLNLKDFVLCQINDIEEIKKYSKDDLLKLIETEIREKHKVLTLDDLLEIAKNNNFPIKVFFYYIPDLMQIIKSIYVSLGFSIDYDIKIKRLQDKVNNLEKEKKILIDREIKMSNVLDNLLNISVEYKPIEKPVYIQCGGEKIREGAVCLSDTHFDEIVSLSETHNLNKYNPDIARERLDRVFTGVLNWSEELKIDKLHIKFLGDLISGIIHEELMINSELGVTNSVIQLADYISQWILELSKYFKEISIIGMVGNHGRFFKKPFYKQKQMLNFDYILYEFIKKEVNKVVKEFIIPDSFIYVNTILDYKFLTLHGDIFSGGTGLNPVSGTIGRDIAKLNGLLRARHMDFDYAEFGHFHHGDSVLTSFDGTIFFMNGSLIGANEYSIGRVKRADRPSQNFYVVEKNKGVLFKTAIYADGK